MDVNFLYIYFRRIFPDLPFKTIYMESGVISFVCFLTGVVHNHSYTSLTLRVCDDHSYNLPYW